MAGGDTPSSKKETRSTKQKEKREKTDEERELKKERKLGRKRDRAEEAMIGDLKRRKEEEKGKSISRLIISDGSIYGHILLAYLAAKTSLHQNGEGDDRYHTRVRFGVHFLVTYRNSYRFSP